MGKRKRSYLDTMSGWSAEQLDGYIQGDDDVGYWTWGHHDPAAFAGAVKLECGEEITPEHVKQEFWRARPASNDEKEDYGYEVIYAVCERGRGAFAVTVCYW